MTPPTIASRIRLETVPLVQLKPSPYNPRVTLKPGMPAYARLKTSLEQFALVQPLVWNRTTGHLVAGHQRLEILKAAGVSELDVVVVELPLAREQALNIALNNPHVGGEWQTDRLLDVLDDLDRLPDFDATLTGFDEDELKQFLLAPDPEFSPADEPFESTGYRVSFEIPTDNWESVRPDLDALLKQHDLLVGR